MASDGPGFEALVKQVDNLSLCLKVSLLKDLCAFFKEKIELMEKTFAESSPAYAFFSWQNTPKETKQKHDISFQLIDFEQQGTLAGNFPACRQSFNFSPTYPKKILNSICPYDFGGKNG